MDPIRSSSRLAAKRSNNRDGNPPQQDGGGENRENDKSGNNSKKSKSSNNSKNAKDKPAQIADLQQQLRELREAMNERFAHIDQPAPVPVTSAATPVTTTPLGRIAQAPVFTADEGVVTSGVTVTSEAPLGRTARAPVLPVYEVAGTPSLPGVTTTSEATLGRIARAPGHTAAAVTELIPPAMPPLTLDAGRQPPNVTLASAIIGANVTSVKANTGAISHPLGSGAHAPMSIPPFMPGITLPLDTAISQQLKDKIWQNKFVAMKQLLPNYQNSPQYTVSLSDPSSMPTLTLTDRPKDKVPLSLEQWTCAFLTYHHVYIQKHPTCSAQLVSYHHLIRTLAAKGANWRLYDENFRQHKQCFPDSPWDRPLMQLYVDAIAGTARVTPTHQQGPSRPDIPQGYCFRFHRPNDQCFRANCPFKHTCYKCHAAHKASQCKRQFPPSATATNSNKR
ncbi:uncharacterized protein LOC144873513 [Branchiostoma floridae x Branchiostoma japonicum]